MYSKYFGELLVKVITIFILLAEVLIATLALFALYKIYSSGTLDFARYTFIGSSLVFIILLIGLRIIRDYEGASRIAIYFGVTSLGLLWASLA
ncbi:hypothetical protein BST91_11230 [Nonlabens tegetincola]|nr:hypothetical protein BST91_11230 [Nonlabens tegetincola]